MRKGRKTKMKQLEKFYSVEYTYENAEGDVFTDVKKFLTVKEKQEFINKLLSHNKLTVYYLATRDVEIWG